MGTRLSKNKGGFLYLESPREQLMKMLVEKTLAAGHTLSFKEVSEDPDMVTPNTYAFYFGSFSEAAETAWKKARAPQRQVSARNPKNGIAIPNSQKPSFGRTDQTVQNYTIKNPLTNRSSGEEIRHSATEPPQTKYRHDEAIGVTSKKPFFNPKSRTSKYTYEKARDLIVSFYKENNRVPTRTDIDSDSTLPCWTTLYRLLGPMSKWDEIVTSALKKEQTEMGELASGKEHSKTDDSAVTKEHPKTDDSAVAKEHPKTDDNIVQEKQATSTKTTSSATPSEPNHLSSTTESVSSAITAKPIINTKYHWEGDILQVEVRVVKPGKSRPVYVTLSV